jgi:hypothetical protein
MAGPAALLATLAAVSLTELAVSPTRLATDAPAPFCFALVDPPDWLEAAFDRFDALFDRLGELFPPPLFDVARERLPPRAVGFDCAAVFGFERDAVFGFDAEAVFERLDVLLARAGLDPFDDRLALFLRGFCEEDLLSAIPLPLSNRGLPPRPGIPADCGPNPVTGPKAA